MDEISKFVMQVRKLLGLNQEDFGERFGASKSEGAYKIASANGTCCQ